MAYTSQRIPFDKPEGRTCKQIPFSLEGKTKLSVTRVSDNGRRKNGFHLPENQFPLAGIRLFFKNWILISRKKCPNKRTDRSRQKE